MEYRVEILGGALRGAKPEELETLLNKVAEENWSLSGFSNKPNTNQMWVILQREGEGEGEGRRPRRRTWLSDWS